MSPTDHRLLREIVVVILIKLVLLTGLWWAFIRDHKVSVDGHAMAAHASAGEAGGTPIPDGETDGHRRTR